AHGRMDVGDGRLDDVERRPAPGAPPAPGERQGEHRESGRPEDAPRSGHDRPHRQGFLSGFTAAPARGPAPGRSPRAGAAQDDAASGVRPGSYRRTPPPATPVSRA